MTRKELSMATSLQKSDKRTEDRSGSQTPVFGNHFCNQMARIRDINATQRERALVTMLKGLTELSDLALYMRKQTESLIREVHDSLGRAEPPKTAADPTDGKTTGA